MRTSIKASLVSASVASLLGSAAHALPPANWADGQIHVFYSGGGIDTAQAVYSAVASLLSPSSIDVYTDGTGTARHPESLNYLIVSGKLGAAMGTLPVGSEIGFMYKYDGGSLVNGAIPQYGSTPLVYPTLASLATAVSTGPVTNSGPYPSSLNPDYLYSSVTANQEVPDWGLTDEEVPLLNTAYNLDAVNQSRPIQFPSVGFHVPLFVIPYGVAVTNALFKLKQVWSASEIAAVVTGSILNWSELNGDIISPLPSSLGHVTLLDRHSGVGTKAAGTAFFCGYPGPFACTPNSVAVTLAGNTFPNGGYTGPLNTSFPMSATEIQDVDEPSSFSTVDDLLTANAAGIGVLAILALEYPPAAEQNNLNTNDYFFATINNIYPDSETGADNINSPSTTGSTRYSSIVNGLYTFAYQTVFHSHFNSSSALPAFQQGVFLNLQSENIAGAHTGLHFPASAQGLLLDCVTTGRTDPGNLTWSRFGSSLRVPGLTCPRVTPADADPL